MSSITSPLIIIGAPCAGKTSACMELVSLYNWKILDLDEEIKRREGLFPFEIISSKGLEEFRKLELQTLKSVLKENYDVISLGGGAIETKEIRELIAKYKIVSFLSDISVLLHRADNDVKKGNIRPLLGRKKEEIKQNLIFLITKREPFYRKANLIVHTDFAEVHHIAETIEDLIDHINLNMNLTAIPINGDCKISTRAEKSVILIGDGAFKVVKSYCNVNHDPKDIIAFVDKNLKSKASKFLDKILETTQTGVVPSGENSKSIVQLESILDKALSSEISRKGAFFAIGGGVVGDLVGFAASVYLRGVDLYQVPSTVVSMVDASIGGKTGINFPLAKNSIGTFHPAKLIACELKLLSSLPEREFISGLAEVIKYGCIADMDFFTWLEKNADRVLSRDPQSMRKIIEKSAWIKASHVHLDLRDKTGVRALLNFGHTLAHALEALSDYDQYLHGEAVSIGMHFAAILGEKMQISDRGFADKLRLLLLKYKLPTYSLKITKNINTSELFKVLVRDKKRSRDEIRYVLVKNIGSAGNFQVKISHIIDILS